MPSVTDILDYSAPPFLQKWLKNNSAAKCDKIKEETAGVGTLVDKLVQEDIKNQKYVLPIGNQEALNCLAQWELLKVEHPEFVPSVTEMQSELMAFDIWGHPDFVNGAPPEWGITDLKCTGGIRDKNWIQEATYARQIMSEKDWPMPSFLRTIRLPRNGSRYEWVEVREQRFIKSLMRMFDSYLGVYNSAKIINEFFRTQNENLILGEF